MRQLWDHIRAAWRLGWRSAGRILFVSPADRWVMATCFHHDRKTGESSIEDQIVDLGRNKLFRCKECGEMWTLDDFEW